MDADDLLLATFEMQHGRATRAQARLLGMTRDQLRWRMRKGHVVARGPRVLARPGAPITKATPLMEAVLDAGTGAVISIRTAAAWWGLPGFDLLTIDVSRPRGMTSAPLWAPARMHEVLDLTSDQVTVLDGIPIVRPERLCFELFATCSYGRAERAAETAWSKGLLSGRSLEFVFEQLAERGRDGTVDTRTFLETHPPQWIPPASGVEARVGEIVKEGALGTWRRQVDLGDERWAGRVDYVHDELPIILEVQSERYHTSLLDVAADRARRDRLVAAGFTFVEVWDTEVWHDRRAVIARVRAAVRSYLAEHPWVLPADRGCKPRTCT